MFGLNLVLSITFMGGSIIVALKEVYHRHDSSFPELFQENTGMVSGVAAAPQLSSRRKSDLDHSYSWII